MSIQYIILTSALLLTVAHGALAQYHTVPAAGRAVTDPSGTTNSRLENSSPLKQEPTTDRNNTNTRIYDNRPAINYSSNAAGSGYPTPPQNYENAIISGTGRTLDEIRTNNNNAYGAASGTHYMNPGTGTITPHYNPIQGRYYYYCTSEYTKKKCNALHRICKDSTDPTHKKGSAYCATPPHGIIQNILQCSPAYRDSLLVPDNTARYSNAAQFFSFDGYIVYEKDTLPGMVTITHNQVSLERKADGNKRRFYLSDLKDPLLTTIVVFKGPKELHMVRLSPTDKHLHRLVHNGKLMLYDRSYSFLTTENCSNNFITISANGKRKVKGKDELVTAVKQTYNTNEINTGMDWPDIIRFINRLD